MFSEAELFGTMPQQKISHPPSSSKKSMHKKEESNSFSAEVYDFDGLSSGIIASNGLDPPLAIVIARQIQDHSWTAIYIKSSTETVAARNNEKSPVSERQRSRSIWPITMWSQIESCLEKHSKECKTLRAKYEIDSSVICIEGDSANKTDASFTDSKKGVAIPGKKQLSSHPGNLLHCHISTITKQVCLAVIRGAEAPSNNGKKRKVSDDDIAKFMDSSLPQLIPENLLGVDVLLRARTAMASSTVNTTENNHAQSISTLKTRFSSSLWDESEWSDKKQKQILSTLGLRKNSPVIAPLKSPYIKRHLGEAGRRRKKTKSTMNHGHLAFFLGTELSQII
ncbi:hypothetical protein HJC23_004814 [Cyclotella cryptica]|uniref:Uncharacterized protein n=1 Tax=Cyclotella cryptica TaxID=29204 RepID=A0ABD3PYS7_9STRA